jgi:tRNA 2-selenouridine synthase
MQKVSVSQIFVQKMALVDVRSPSEYAHGHIPGALNLPLFSDDERAAVGIAYKTTGRRSAIEKGLEIVRFSRIVQEIRQFALPSNVYVYCARGGMRSSSMGWLLELLGYRVFLIDGGYKSFRRWALEQFSYPYSLVVLGGETGSGKTKILKELEKREEAVLDLENLAHHRGSVFGGFAPQPTQEHFENCLSCDLFQKRDKTIWVEDESRRLGSVNIPPLFFERMRESALLALEISEEIRMQECLNEYLSLGDEKIAGAIRRLEKRLGGSEMRKALEDLEQKRYSDCCRTLIRYYDKKYRYGMSLRDPKKVAFISSSNVEEIKNRGDRLLKKRSLLRSLYLRAPFSRLFSSSKKSGSTKGR